MSRVTILGGSGAVGSVAAETLASSGFFSEIVLADSRLELAKKLAGRLKANKVSAVKFDASNPQSIKKTVAGSKVVLNCVGPFYKYGPVILKAVIDSKINYVDICDDFDATEEMLGMDKAAKKAGVSALIGMGSSPGFANVLVRF